MDSDVQGRKLDEGLADSQIVEVEEGLQADSILTTPTQTGLLAQCDIVCTDNGI